MRPLLALLQVLAASPSPAPCMAPEPADARGRLQVALGRQLFFEPRLSATGTHACASCHQVTAGGGGADARAFSTGIGGRLGGRNTPTVWNAARRQRLFWDGRAASLEEQAAGPLLNPVEMGLADGAEAVRALAAVEGYRTAFAAAFGDGRPRSPALTFEEVLAALAAFERTLVTCPSPFDVAMAGGPDRRSEAARRGWQLFRTIGCLACHGTPTFSGSDTYARFPQRSVDDLELVLGLTRDRGRGGVTLAPSDDQRWRVPSLRNVELTAPYFHNGAAATLEQAVRVMGRAQLARTLEDAEVADLAAFLRSLTGERPEVVAPALPR